MSRRCTICDHAERAEIDRALAANSAPIRRIAAHHAVSPTALRRHAELHLPAAMVEAVEAGAVAHGGNLLGQVHDLHARALRLLVQAETAGDLRTSLTAIREARGCVELLARLEGQLQERATVNVLVAPDWLQLRGALLAALAPFPEARAAVASALGTGGGDA